MAKNSKQRTTIFIIITAVVMVVGAKWVIGFLKPSLTEEVSSRTKGNPDAKLKITEFIDFQCPACAQGSMFLSQYIKEYPDRIYLTVKYFPITIHHQHAYRSAHFAECAARQGKFWQFHDLLVERQYQWKDLFNADPVFEKFAQESNLDIEQLDACLKDDRVRGVISKDKGQGNAWGVRSTPTYLINGKTVVGTRSLIEELKANFGTEN